MNESTLQERVAAVKPRAAPLPLLFAALIVPTVPNFILLASAERSLFWVAQSVTSILVVLAPLFAGFRPRTALLLMSPFAAFMPFASAYAIATGFPPSIMAWQVLREATVEELMNFLPQLLLGAAASAAIVLGYWYVARRCGLGSWRMHPAIRFAGLALLAASLGKDIAANGIRTGSGILVSRLEKMHPLSPVVIQAHVLIGGSVAPDRSPLLRQHKVQHESVPNAREICVVVIGESARKSAWGLYNPAAGTTPKLGGRDLVVFKDAMSPATVTFQSVPMLLTGHLPEKNEILPFERVGLVEAFRIGGFHTAWISMQQADGEISSLITAFTSNAAETGFLNGRMDRSKYRHRESKQDGELVGRLSQLISAQPGNIFVILHTMGSHAPYVQHYPAEFQKWPVDPATKTAIRRWLPPYDQHQRQQIDNAYLNTIVYTDTVLDQLINVLEQAGGITSLFYFSDHGENDAGSKLMPAAHAVPTKDVLEVPFFVWLSPALKSARPGVKDWMTRNSGCKVSGLDLFATVCDVHGLRTPAATPSRSLAGPGYVEQQRRVVLLDGSIVTEPTRNSE